MADESGREQYFNPAKPLVLGEDNPCGNMRPTWPHKVCNRRDGHKGDHCNRTQAGTKVIEVWWSKDAWREVAAKS